MHANHVVPYLIAIIAGALTALTAVLWMTYGERIFFDRLVAAIVNCF